MKIDKNRLNLSPFIFHLGVLNGVFMTFLIPSRMQINGMGGFTFKIRHEYNLSYDIVFHVLHRNVQPKSCQVKNSDQHWSCRVKIFAMNVFKIRALFFFYNDLHSHYE